MRSTASYRRPASDTRMEISGLISRWGRTPIFILGPKKFTRNSGCLNWPERRIPASANDLVGNVCAIPRKVIEGHCAFVERRGYRSAGGLEVALRRSL